MYSIFEFKAISSSQKYTKLILIILMYEFYITNLIIYAKLIL